MYFAIGTCRVDLQAGQVIAATSSVETKERTVSSVFLNDVSCLFFAFVFIVFIITIPP